MKTSEFTMYRTRKGNIRRIAKYTNGVEKRQSKSRIDMALDMSGRIYNAIETLAEGEKLIITCYLIEHGDN